MVYYMFRKIADVEQMRERRSLGEGRGFKLWYANNDKRNKIRK
jgi:hypothetical protein